jgi:hypothetical protein
MFTCHMRFEQVDKYQVVAARSVGEEDPGIRYIDAALPSTSLILGLYLVKS